MTELSEQKRRFYSSVLPARPNEWEVDEVFEHLEGLQAELRDILLNQVEVIWPISHSLCFSYLTEGVSALRLFSAELIPEWVRRILDVYEKKGLVGAREFMTEVDRLFLGPMKGEAGVGFVEVAATLLPYIRGVSGLRLDLDVASLPGTDTRTVYLPEFLGQFLERKKNILLYKLIVTLQWGQIASGIYKEVADGEGAEVRDPLARYPETTLARDLLAALQFRKIFRFLAAELPGLIRQGRELCFRLIETIAPGGSEEKRCEAMRSLLLQAVSDSKDEKRHAVDGQSMPAVLMPGPGDGWDTSCLAMLPAVYDYFSDLEGSYRLGAASLLLGELNFQRAGEAISLRRMEEKQKFVAMLAAFLAGDGEIKKHASPGGEQKAEAFLEDVLALLLPPTDRRGKREGGETQILLDNEGVKIPEALTAAARDIVKDLGEVPKAYVQAAAGLAGSGFNSQENQESSDTVPCRSVGAYSYDEWDYRRGGYRADWCTLEEKSVVPVRSDFVGDTLLKYTAQQKKLRRQFEQMRTSDRVVRRQRYGDDIDIDALTEALGDYRAGLTPSDRLFTRLLRDERDITAMFLVDMSSSTEGWVGTALKETLVLLAEALEVVGDRYGIYGFSGMRRSRSELYHIKHPDEAYGALVQQRIAAISPKEYTRMGPPIRHLTGKLLESPGKIRLLVVISDGKPEDYDDYKGRYAIEDTRKALLEARGAGVHPFCITVDKSAHDYLMHMLGRGNYIFINDVKALPAKMVHMYRLLTS